MPWVTWGAKEPQYGMGKSIIFDFVTGKHLVTDFNMVPMFCEVNEAPKFRLRGACENSAVDTYFILKLEGNIVKPLLVGYTNTRIQPAFGQTWQIVDARNGS